LALARTGFIAFLCLTLGGAIVFAQSTPQQQPLLQSGNVVYAGSFTLPSSDGTGRSGEQSSLHYGGTALGLGPDGQSLYYGCHAWHNMLAQVRIPAIGGTATILTPCTRIPNLAAIDPDANESKVLGGSLSWNGRTLVSAYTFYDGAGNATASHFAGPTLTTLAGPVRLSGSTPGLVGGYMGVVPPEWRTLLGGPALTGLCCTAVISRSSYGPAVSVFDPDLVGAQSPVPSRLLVGYPDGHATLGAWGSSNPLFNGATKIGGVAFPTGTRSVLFVGRHGDDFCYGEGADCHDPTDASKGNHAYPYRHQVWAYDANDLLAVKQGTKKPWDVQPYATWTLSGMSDDGSAKMTSAFYDPASRRLYVVATAGSVTPRVHVYNVTSTVLSAAPRTSAAPLRLVGRVNGTTAHFTVIPPLGSTSEHVLEAGLAPGRADYVLPLGATTSLSVPSVPTGRYFVRAREASATSQGRVSNEVTISVGCTQKPSRVSALTSETQGAVVSLNWVDPDGCSGTSYRVTIGSAAGTNTSAQVLAAASNSMTTRLAAGTYSARVAAVSALGAGEPSNEVQFSVTGSGCSVPTFRTALTSRVSRHTVRLKWSPVDPARASDEDRVAPVSYVLEVGSASGAKNIYPAMSMQRASSLVAQAPPGQYFVRVLPMNACGAGVASNEVRVVVQ
jgi:hypothetical protein